MAKRRLADVMEPDERAALVEDVAVRTIDAARSAGHSVGVVSDDDELLTWARGRGIDPIREPLEEAAGLDRAARAGVREARRRGLAWAIVHGDLPLVTEDDLRAVSDELPTDGLLLAPSYDGGTNVLAGHLGKFPFAYGQGSFRRHLARATEYPIRVLVRPGLALDLDSSQDLSAAGLG